MLSCKNNVSDMILKIIGLKCSSLTGRTCPIRVGEGSIPSEYMVTVIPQGILRFESGHTSNRYLGC